MKNCRTSRRLGLRSRSLHASEEVTGRMERAPDLGTARSWGLTIRDTEGNTSGEMW
eukprot:CAMPEP_0184342818 /NCGR_PEP_ID=MMETSP1089-20130417/11393_1 /TAXON_ID=38269 ORGANISM="Gloeochaete wittrockiana, Strain SAG46.84" /NCGR_SAMPLE_ID=MMETSP1089 /ASSEMBLY_ACC=CAM_ASM_000445 /LENGTH=55 /DNA_ID=CAMNT_0026671843 /DNA_START=167 /DNA_END=331 /DNA_ORIENTATION=+